MAETKKGATDLSREGTQLQQRHTIPVRTKLATTTADHTKVCSRIQHDNLK